MHAAKGQQSVAQRAAALLQKHIKSPEQRALGMGREWLERARTVRNRRC